MIHYLLSYDLIDSPKFDGSYRTEIINFLLDNGAKNLSSRLATTIYFQSEFDLPDWKKKFKNINEDIYYYIAIIEVDDKGKPKETYLTEIKFRENFEADLAAIIKQRGENK